MAATPNLTLHDSPLPILRGIRVVDISTQDLILERGFICVPNEDGTLVFRTLEKPDVDEERSGLSSGAVVGLAGIPVGMVRVRNAADSNTSVSSITIGIL